MKSYRINRNNKFQYFLSLYLVLTVCLCFFHSGCLNPSHKKLSKILEQTESLAILSVPGHCNPHYYPSSEFSWDRVWEGVSEGATEGFAGISEFCKEGGYPAALAGLVYSFIRVPVGALVGGVSKTGERSRIIKSYYRYTLRNAFEDRNPGGQVAQRIHTNCKDTKPELVPQRVYWSDREGTEYMIASSGGRKAKMKEFYKTLDSSGNQMLLKIHATDYGLSGGTRKNLTSCFFMIVQAELIRSKDGKRVYRREFEYKSVARSIREWEVNQGQALKKEFNQAYQNIGDQISNEFLESKDGLRNQTEMFVKAKSKTSF